MHHYPKEELFDLALKDGKLTHISEVKENGLECGCFCCDCKEPLVAYNTPGSKKAHHFQHHSRKNCRNAYETSLHYLAKGIIQETLTLTVPDVKYELKGIAREYGTHSSYSPKEKYSDVKLNFTKVEIEKSVENFRPDLKCYIGEKVVYVEIAVTHFVDDNKRKKIIEHGIPVLEIDLSRISRDNHKSSLTNALKGSSHLMKWVFNPKLDQRLEKAEHEKQRIRNFVNEKAKVHQAVRRGNYIFQCPLYKNSYDYVRIEETCKNCICFVGDVYPNLKHGHEEEYREREGIICIGDDFLSFLRLLEAHRIKPIHS